MSNLKELQQQFQDYLLKGDKTIFSQLIASQQGSTQNRIDIYRNGYFARLQNNLMEDFPGLKIELGEAKFKELMTAYLQHYPSQHYSVAYVGDRLADFIRENYAESFWAELASFELQMINASLAENKPWLDLSALAKIPTEQQTQLKFLWHPSVRQCSFHFNTPEYWQSLLDGKKIKLQANKKAASYLIWNFQYEIYFMCLSKNELAVANAINQQLSFAELCETIADLMPAEKLVPWIAETIRTWVEQGLLIL